MLGVCVVGVVGWEGGEWVSRFGLGSVFGDVVDCVVGLVFRGVDVEVVEGFRFRVFRDFGVFPHVIWLDGLGDSGFLGGVLGLAREVVVLSGGRRIVVVVGRGEAGVWGVLLAFFLAGARVSVGVYLEGEGFGVEPGILGELGEGLGELDARVLRVLAEAPGLDARGVAERLGVSTKTVSNRLSLLRSRGLVERRRGVYRVTERGLAVMALRGLRVLHGSLGLGVALGLEERPYDPRGTEGCLEEGCDG